MSPEEQFRQILAVEGELKGNYRFEALDVGDPSGEGGDQSLEV
jgi:hypothetical protein